MTAPVSPYNPVWAGAEILPLKEHSQRAFAISDFCRTYGIGRSTTYKAIAAGLLEARKCGRRTIITSEAADRFVASLPAATFGKDREAA